MDRLPDAPWIRDAERYGAESAEPVYCPCCGEECTTIYADSYGTVFACNWCVMEQDANEWQDEKRESEREWFEEHRRGDDE